MSQEQKYPIKYAVLELKERGGWLVGYEDIIRGYIASKCYVVESLIKYLPSGKQEILHKVVFPITDLEGFKLKLSRNSLYFEKDSVKYDACNNPYPIRIVEEIFDNYEETKIQAKHKNKDLERKIIINGTIHLPISNQEFKETLKKLKNEFTEQLSICELFEQTITENTKDMEITKEYLPLVKTRTKTT